MELMKIIKVFYDSYKFCLVPLYIAPNKKSSDRLLNTYKKLTKTIWPSISLIKHNDPSFPNQGIDPDDDDIKDYDNTVDFYHSRKIIKTSKQNNAIEVRTGTKFNLTVIDLDNIYLTFELFLKCFQSASIITKTKKGFHFYYQYTDK